MPVRARRWSLLGAALALAALALTAVVAGAVAAPAQNGLIAFTSLRSGSGVTYTVAPDGQGLRRVAGGPLSLAASGPAFSPDGSRLAFGCGNFELCVASADGSAPARLTTTAWPRSYAYDSDPAWSPDGQTIAFVRLERGTSSIWLVDADGSDLRRLPGVPAGSSEYPAFSPDGATMAFEHEPPSDDRSLDSRIYAIAIDGSALRPLTPAGVDAGHPAWSPDGTMIAYSRSDDDGDDDVFVMGADGSTPRRLSRHSGDAPAWSPDGTRIAYATGAGIFHAALDGSGPARVSADPFAGVPAWQPTATGFAGTIAAPQLAPTRATQDARVAGATIYYVSGMGFALSGFAEGVPTRLFAREMARVSARARTVARRTSALLRPLRPATARGRSLRRLVLRDGVRAMSRMSTGARAVERAARRGDTRVLARQTRRLEEAVIDVVFVTFQAGRLAGALPEAAADGVAATSAATG